jgi:hypothetical protein
VFPTFDAAMANLRLEETTVEPDDTRTFYEELLSTAFQPAGERLRPVNRELHRLSNV